MTDQAARRILNAPYRLLPNLAGTLKDPYRAAILTAFAMIDADLQAFLEGGLGIHVASRTARLEPNGARAAAVKVDEDRLHFTVYAAEVAAARILPDLRANGAAAVVFARPVDDRACQIKGIFVEARPAEAAERAFVEQQWSAFLDNLEAIGIPRAAPSRWATWPAVAIRLRATAIFEQTPGPDAGARIVAPPSSPAAR